MKKRRKSKPALRKPTNLDLSFGRIDEALVTLFEAGFSVRECSALLRRSEGSVLMTLRKRIAR